MGSTVVAFFFLVLMPLNTSFDLIDSYSETICRKSSIKVRVVMSMFASPVASSDRSVMILYLNNQWSLSFNRIYCAATISNKGIFILNCVPKSVCILSLRGHLDASYETCVLFWQNIFISSVS